MKTLVMQGIAVAAAVAGIVGSVKLSMPYLIGFDDAVNNSRYVEIAAHPGLHVFGVPVSLIALTYFLVTAVALIYGVALETQRLASLMYAWSLSGTAVWTILLLVPNEGLSIVRWTYLLFAASSFLSLLSSSYRLESGPGVPKRYALCLLYSISSIIIVYLSMHRSVSSTLRQKEYAYSAREIRLDHIPRDRLLGVNSAESLYSCKVIVFTDALCVPGIDQVVHLERRIAAGESIDLDVRYMRLERMSSFVATLASTIHDKQKRFEFLRLCSRSRLHSKEQFLLYYRLTFGSRPEPIELRRYVAKIESDEKDAKAIGAFASPTLVLCPRIGLCRQVYAVPYMGRSD